MRGARHGLLIALYALVSCSEGTDESSVSLRIYEGVAICDREACVDENGDVVPGEAVAASAILSRSVSQFDPGVYLYVGAYREDRRFFELEVDVPTLRTGSTGVEALYREYSDGVQVYESEIGGGQVRLILEDSAKNPPAGRFDLSFEDGSGELRRVVGQFHRYDAPPVSDRPIVDQVGEDDREVVYVDYDPTPDDWDIYIDQGCSGSYESESGDPVESPESDGGGCEGDSGGGDAYDGGDGCEGSGSSGGGGGGCEGDTGGGGGCSGGGGGGCEGDTGGGSCDGGDSCSIAGKRTPRAIASKVWGQLFPYALVAIVLGAWRLRERHRRG